MTTQVFEHKNNAHVVAILTALTSDVPMVRRDEVRAIAGRGLEGDRYTAAQGSFNKDKPGKRQVTLINAIFFPGTIFTYEDARRNIVVKGVELPWLIDRYFKIGDVLFKGLKYCDPCPGPQKHGGKTGFVDAFYERAGIVAEILTDGIICVNSPILTVPKGY